MRAKIGKQTIARSAKDAATTKRAVFIFDTELTGFMCRVSPHGQVSWIVQKWQGGRCGHRNRVVFGSYPAVTIDAARSLAQGHLGDLAKGIDLPNKRREARQAKLAALRATTLEQASMLYLRKVPESRYGKEVRRKFSVEILPHFKPGSSVREIKKADVRRFLESKEAQGFDESARALFAQLRPFFKWCVERDMLDVSPCDDITPPKATKARDRILSDDEIKALWRATDHEGLPYPYGAFFRLLLLTAQRRDEVSGMRWTELDLGAGLWIVPKERTKNGKEHLVHLSPLALSILQSLNRSCAYVFPSSAGTAIAAYSDNKDRLDALMPEGIPPWRIHDLRRTAASGMAKVGIQPHIIERVLNHVSGVNGGLVAVYQRHEYSEERKRALSAWSNYVYSLMQPPEINGTTIAVPQLGVSAENFRPADPEGAENEECHCH